jgi:Xaa-Pro aminopeptidase
VGRPARRQEGAVRDFGADDAFPITDIDDILPGLIEGRDRVYSAMGSNPNSTGTDGLDQRDPFQSAPGAQPPNEFVALDHLLHDMRLYKSAAEVKVMREARDFRAAHVRAMQASRAGLHEFSLEAELDYEFPQGRGEDAGLRLDRRGRTQQLHPALPAE